MMTIVKSQKSETEEIVTSNELRVTRLKNQLSIVRFVLVTCYLLLTTYSSAMAASQDLETVIKNHLKNNYPWAEIEIKALKLSEDITGDPESFRDVRITVEKGPPGRTILLMEFNDARKVKATADVRALDRIVMSRRAFRKGYCLQNDDVYVTMMDMMRIPKGAIKNSEHIIGRPLTRSIVANTPVLDNMIGETPAIKKGQRVIILAESPDFRITTIGEIKENGYVGSYVKVVNLTSKKVLKGLLVDENTVKVEF